MKGIPALKSKLKMPLLPPAVVVSERLQRLCDELFKQQAVIITAPAGYGKTTLLVTALNKYKPQGSRICWYRLDEGDRDLAVFYTHLVETLFPEEEEVWEEQRGHLAGCGDIFARHQYLNALICQELWALHNQRPDMKSFIVFDDFHQVRDTPDIYDAIQLFIDNLPGNCTVMFSSRCETGLLTGKRCLEKSILEITRRELCFSEEETTSLIKGRYRISPGRDLLQKIMRHTEGWPAGIILICQILSGSNIAEAGSILDRSSPKELLFQYIASEALEAVDNHLLRFLVKTAILSEFTAAEAAAIFAEGNARQLLEKCHQKGLFLQKITGDATTYRFHSLFREALQQIQPSHLSPAEVKNYHLKAAAYYIEHRFFERAIEHFIACGNVNLAAELVLQVARESVNLLAFEAVEQFRLWFKLLPEEIVSNNGYLLYIKSFITFPKKPGDALQLLERALEIFRHAGDCIMQLYSLLSMSQMYIERNDIKELKRIHRLALMLEEKRGQPLEWMLAVFDFTVAVAEGELSRGVSLFRRLKPLELTGEWQWLAFLYSSQMYCLLGELNLAENRIREALELDMVKKAELLRGYARLCYSMVLHLKDEQDSHPLIMEEMTEIGEKHDYNYLLGFGRRLAAFAGYRRHDLGNALELLDASTWYFEEIGNTAMASSNMLYRCLWQCGQSIAAEVFAAAEQALKTLTAAPSGKCFQEIGLSVFGAIARQAGDYKLAEKSLTAAVKRSKDKGARQVVAGSCLHLAKLCYDTGDQAGGENYLRQAFALAAENKYVTFWDMHYPTLVEMAARCVKSNIHAVYARDLIARHFGDEAADFLDGTAALATDKHFKDFTRAFLSRYGVRNESQTPMICVNLLGRFGITVNGVTIPENEWKTKKIAGVLKFLLVHRGRPVSKDRLMEVFWPGVEKKLASMSLRAAQYELKKVSRKYGLAEEGNSLLLNEKRDSLAVRTGKMLVVDVDLFLAHFTDLEKFSPGESGREQKKDILERMIALYQGDLLEEEIYEDWTFAEREELRSVYFVTVMELADIYIMDGDMNKAEKLLLKTLTMDQYNEEACLRLLKLYIAANQRGRAVRHYAGFAKRFEKELGVKPDERLSAVIKKHR